MQFRWGGTRPCRAAGEESKVGGGARWRARGGARKPRQAAAPHRQGGGRCMRLQHNHSRQVARWRSCVATRWWRRGSRRAAAAGEAARDEAACGSGSACSSMGRPPGSTEVATESSPPSPVSDSARESSTRPHRV
jgi:hypothetical protein